MAIQYLEDSTLGGVPGIVNRLVNALDAERPNVLTTKTTDKNGKITEKQHTEWVPDNATRDKALGKVIDIYGLKAPVRKDVTVAVSMSSDEDLFRQIEQAARECKFVESHAVGEEGEELALRESQDGAGSFASRRRTLLQDDPLPEQE